MEVRADITRADYEAFRRHAERRVRAGLKRPSFRLLIVAWAIAAVIFSWLYTTTDWAPRYIVSAGIGVVLGFVVYNWTAKLQHADLSPEEGGYLLGERTFATVEDGLRVRGANTELIIRRAAIRAVEQTGEHVFVYIDRGAAVIVPKRAFGDAAEIEQFVRDLM